ncbi:MAG TPA: 2Fe-2S iron-sulfur cluster-binding protein, partial [Thermoleophilia bacterium]|nr:2Fe-2S iron-sulfur cluster-binding protein [Thermoleophilia bacterium]
MEVEVEEGENLLRAALAGDVQLNASCGGAGTCGKCRVKVRSGVLEAEPGAKLTEAEIREGFALACRSTVLEDAEVEVAEEHLLVAGKPPYERRRRILAQQLRAGRSFEDQLPSFAPDPLTKKVFLELREPTVDDPEADWDRLRRELERLGFDPVSIELGALRQLALALRDGGWQATATLAVTEDEGFRLTRVEPGDTTSTNFGIAVDLGTTTIVAELLDLNTGRVLAEASDYNGQIRCGEDVISRMVFAAKPGGLEQLQLLAASTINGLISELLEQGGVPREDVNLVVAAGNTTMIHLLLSLPPKYIREAP